MPKKKIYILGFVLLIVCVSAIANHIINSRDSSIEERDIIISNVESDLNGTWGLTNYFDTIIANKELAKYRLQTPTWFAIILEIENDSLRNFGSIYRNQYPIKQSNDTLTILSSYVTGENWSLIKEGLGLKLIQYPNPENIDSTIYIFRKRDDLNYFTKENRDFFIIDKNVSNYFNIHLFEGKYINKDTNQEVVFGNNGHLSGIDDFDFYEINNYFGTLHPYKNLDVIFFMNADIGRFKSYNWVFSNDELLLTEFVREKIMHDGETYDGDYFVLGKEKIRLKREHNK